MRWVSVLWVSSAGSAGRAEVGARWLLWSIVHIASVLLRSNGSIDLGILVLDRIVDRMVGQSLVLRRTARSIVVMAMAVTSRSEGNTRTNTLRTVAAGQGDLRAVLVTAKRNQVLSADCGSVLGCWGGIYG
jgi:hypothetical protein